jgi:hypothetical protein
MAVEDAVLLLTVSRAHTRIHVEHDASRRAATVHEVDPLAGQVGKRREVPRCREPLRLEAAHLARRGRKALRCLAADDPAHCRIVTQALGIVHIVISSEAAEDRLPQQTDQRMASVLAGARSGELRWHPLGVSSGLIRVTAATHARRT